MKTIAPIAAFFRVRLRERGFGYGASGYIPPLASDGV